MKHSIYLGLGSNLGDSRSILRQAVADIRLLFQKMNSSLATEKTIIEVSPLYQSAPVATPNAQPMYWNAVVCGIVDIHDSSTTALTNSAENLLQALLAIELKAGRVRQQECASRTLDIDMLSFGTLIQSSPTLTLPHLEISNRRFVLEPLLAIARSLSTNMILPKIGNLHEAMTALMATPNILQTQYLTCVVTDGSWAD